MKTRFLDTANLAWKHALGVRAHEKTVPEAVEETVFVLASVRRGSGRTGLLQTLTKYQCPDLRVEWLLRESNISHRHADVPSETLPSWFREEETCEERFDERYLYVLGK